MFTKYDQFKRNVKMDWEDDPEKDSIAAASSMVEKTFQEIYNKLGGEPKFVQLEGKTLCLGIEWLTMPSKECTRQEVVVMILSIPQQMP